jgi:hypothetical protein
MTERFRARIAEWAALGPLQSFLRQNEIDIFLQEITMTVVELHVNASLSFWSSNLLRARRTDIIYG